jgi:hypothetical protein
MERHRNGNRRRKRKIGGIRTDAVRHHPGLTVIDSRNALERALSRLDKKR